MSRRKPVSDPDEVEQTPVRPINLDAIQDRYRQSPQDEFDAWCAQQDTAWVPGQ